MWMEVFTYLKDKRPDGGGKMWKSLCFCRHGRTEYEYIRGSQLRTSFFTGCFEILSNYQQRLMWGWRSYNQHLTPEILTHPFPVFLSVSVSLCVWACFAVYVLVCMHIYVRVCGFLFMKHALPSHTVGVSRSSSLAINHCRQLTSAQSACERSACVRVWACMFATTNVWSQQSSKIPLWPLTELEVASADTYLTCSMNASPVAFVLLSLSAHYRIMW